jgi:hypothetical protein
MLLLAKRVLGSCRYTTEHPRLRIGSIPQLLELIPMNKHLLMVQTIHD